MDANRRQLIMQRQDVIEYELLPNPANGGGSRAIVLEKVKRLLR